MAMTFQPIGFRVLVEQKLRADLGVLVPENTDEIGFVKRTVIALGQAHIAANGREVPIPVNIGDEVLVDVKDPRKFTPIPTTFSGDRVLAIIDVDCIKCVNIGSPERVRPPIVRATKIPELVH